MVQLSPARDAAALRTFTLGEGVLMLVLGLLAMIFPLAASLWVTAMVALIFLVGGLLGWINNLMRARLLGRWLAFWRLVVSTLLVAAGLSMLLQLGSGPTQAAAPIATLALAIGVVFVVEGLVALGVSLAHRRIRGWGWGLLNGLITLALGTTILLLPGPVLLQVLGLLVGISFVFSGLDLLSFSASFHGPDQDTAGQPEPPGS
ncbi:DUF308 domain-containing protein [Cyanobium sp. NS01]|uniref:DUF308 domain-containing protein n=1 Tax=Cyanobium sp. NS01 TaxID=261284 RepID=UPI001644B886|nr:DUF308 domain-containing protein [Cyanobium sp. NS01]QNI71340.1 uncharacterized conserved membrane protein (DUF308) [Cyanobium sp. NS01]